MLNIIFSSKDRLKEDEEISLRRSFDVKEVRPALTKKMSSKRWRESFDPHTLQQAIAQENIKILEGINQLIILVKYNFI